MSPLYGSLGRLSIREAEWELFSGRMVPHFVLIWDFKTQFKLCEVHVELDVQAIIGVYIHSLDDVSSDHLLHFHVAAVEHFCPLEDSVVVGSDAVALAFAFGHFFVQSCQCFIRLQHLCAGGVDQFGEDIHREGTLALHRFDDLDLQGFVFLGGLGALILCRSQPFLQADHCAPMGTGYDLLLFDSLHPVEHLMQDIGHQLVQNVHRVACLSVTLLTLAGLVVADIADSLATDSLSIGVDPHRSIGGQGQAATAVTAEHVAGQQGLAPCVSGHRALFLGLVGTLIHELLRQPEGFGGDNLEFGNDSGLDIAVSQDASVQDAVQDAANACFVPVLSVTGLDAVLVEEHGDLVSAVAGANAEVIHKADDLCFFLVNDQLEDFVLSLIVDAAGYQLVAIRGDTATEAALLGDELVEGFLGTHGGFLALAIGLPVADIVGQSVDMGVDPLLTLIDAPHTDVVLNQPLHHEGSFLGSSADAVEHEHQQDIKLALLGILFDLLDLVTLTGTLFEARDTVLLFLEDDGPTHLVCKLSTGPSLHRDVCLVIAVEVDLLCGGNSV